MAQRHKTMPECDQGLHRLTRTLGKSFSFRQSPSWKGSFTGMAICRPRVKWHYHYINRRPLTALRLLDSSPTLQGPIGSSHRRTPTLEDRRGAESVRAHRHTGTQAHRLALNLVISSRCCSTPRSRDAQTRQIPSDLPSNAVEETGSLCHGRSMNRANPVFRETLTCRLLCIHSSVF